MGLIKTSFPLACHRLDRLLGRTGARWLWAFMGGRQLLLPARCTRLTGSNAPLAVGYGRWAGLQELLQTELLQRIRSTEEKKTSGEGPPVLGLDLLWHQDPTSKRQRIASPADLLCPALLLDAIPCSD